MPYFYKSKLNGRDHYERVGGKFGIWWDGGNEWFRGNLTYFDPFYWNVCNPTNYQKKWQCQKHDGIFSVSDRTSNVMCPSYVKQWLEFGVRAYSTIKKF